MQCPQRTPDYPYAAGLDGPDHYRADDHTCSYCGSLNPDVFMARLEAGDIALGATTKNYKVYVHNAGGAPLLQTYRDCPRDEPKHMPDECAHWVTRETSQQKFYFDHLSNEQRQRFVEMYNERRIRMKGGFAFSPFPFFMQRVGG
jgi:hypothetical protein